MHDLRETIDRLLKPRVVAVNEDENLAPGRTGDPLVEIRAGVRQFETIGAKSDKVALRVAGRR